MNRTALVYLLTEFGPILVFFLAGRLTDFYTAVAVFMCATAISCGLSWYLEKHLPVIPLLSAAFVLIGGAVTLTTTSPDGIIFADTMYYLGISSILGISLLRRGLLLKRLFSAVFAITDEGWRKLTIRWLLVLLLAAVANEYVRLTMPAEFWIDYRFYKTIAITLFALYQFTLSRTYRIEGEANHWGIRIKRPESR